MKMKIFEKTSIASVDLNNRIIMAPMCMYSSDNSGVAKQFHFQHYGARAIGGVGLIIQEATAVNKNGRLSNKDLGIWQDGDQVEVLKNLVSYVKTLNPQTKMMVQLAHSGRKVDLAYKDDIVDVIAPSAIKFNDKYVMPKEMSIEDINQLKKDFVEATKRSLYAGYDGIELHCAHGYLLNSFLSSITNKRTDSYGGNLENRVRIVSEILNEIREFYPKNKMLFIRLSAVDYSDVNLSMQETLQAVKLLEHLVDAIHVSSGGVTDVAPKSYPLYQTNFATQIKQVVNVPVIAVGLITTKQEAEYILQSQSADFVALGRELLRNPYWVLLNNDNLTEVENIPVSYKRALQ